MPEDEKDEYEKEVEELVEEARRFRNCISMGRSKDWDGYTISRWMAEFAVTKAYEERQRIIEMLEDIEDDVRDDFLEALEKCNNEKVNRCIGEKEMINYLKQKLKSEEEDGEN